MLLINRAEYNAIELKKTVLEEQEEENKNLLNFS